MNKIYDFIVIGAGISGCTFASSLNTRFSDASILLVEHGRRLGGRATSRKSRKNKNLEFDHGLPSISFSKNISEDIYKFITPLIKSHKLIDITKDILLINEFGEIHNELTNYKIYRSMPFMINFCEEIVNQSINPKKINFLFKKFIKSMKRVNNLWELEINKDMLLRSKNLILSSSLIAHPRCLDILNINSIPLSDAFLEGKDDIVDSLIRQTKRQKYTMRRNYILYVSNSEIVKYFDHKYLQIYFSKIIKDNFNFERIIFQGQPDGSMIIVLHCYFFDNFFDINVDKIMKNLRKIFIKHQTFLDLFLHSRLIDKMDWRASQPINNLVSRELQWSSANNIGFCGDWFEVDGCQGVETAMNSAINLAKLLNWN